jgi:hypothetical protein
MQDPIRVIQEPIEYPFRVPEPLQARNILVYLDIGSAGQHGSHVLERGTVERYCTTITRVRYRVEFHPHGLITFGTDLLLDIDRVRKAHASQD